MCSEESCRKYKVSSCCCMAYGDKGVVRLKSEDPAWKVGTPSIDDRVLTMVAGMAFGRIKDRFLVRLRAIIVHSSSRPVWASTDGFQSYSAKSLIASDTTSAGMRSCMTSLPPPS